tara:strand:+ start:1576 stop:2673 length:1098 start_codon:yes stop_codon:yes gene_type:complete
MNICIIGDGLTSLTLAKSLINKKINVSICHVKKTNNSPLNRTIGLTKNNLNFFEEEIIKFSKQNIWQIKKIKIYSEKSKNHKILDFEDNSRGLFYMIRNDKFYQLLNQKLLKNKFFKKILINKDNFYEKLVKENKYNLIINCDQDNPISKKYFNRKIDKDYYNIAYTTFLKHEELENNTAIQIFTKVGPIAFLPISNTKTSVVFSVESKVKKYIDEEVLSLINKHNPKFKIKKISKLSNFKLKASNLRNYYHTNILAFGDLLHKIHPLAGQGFNMSIRDIKVLSKIIQQKIDLGIQLDALVLEEFEKKTKHKNFIFSQGVDLVYEIFNFDKQFKSNSFNKVLSFFGKNKTLNNSIIKFADRGLNI